MIAPETLDSILSEIEHGAAGDVLLSALRARFPDVHFTLCADDDVGAVVPHRTAAGFNVYLVDGRDHCLKLTTEPAAATGLVLGELYDGE